MKNLEQTKKQQELIIKLIQKIKPEELTTLLIELKEIENKNIIKFLFNSVGNNRKLYEENIEVFEKEFSFETKLNWEEKQANLLDETMAEINNLTNANFEKKGSNFREVDLRFWLEQNVVNYFSEEGEKIKHLIKNTFFNEGEKRVVDEDCHVIANGSPDYTKVIFKNGLKIEIAY